MTETGIDPEGLEHLRLFADHDASDLADLAALLTERRVASGETLMRQGEPGDWFALVIEGAASVTCTDPTGERSLGRVGAGSILGELSLLRAAPRAATVTATTPLTALVGDAEAFAALLALDDVRARLTRAAAQRLATHASPVEVRLRDGTRLHLRPVLPSDRRGLEAGLAQMSPDSLRRRFFTGGPLSDRILDYLVDLDYVRHFAWVAVLVDHADTGGIAMARYVRDRTDPTSAEIAIGIVDEYQGRGLGTLLLGALAVGAATAGVVRLTGDALADNVAVRRLLDRAGATWSRGEPGVMTAAVEVARAAEVIDPGVAADLADTARATISAATFPLA